MTVYASSINLLPETIKVRWKEPYVTSALNEKMVAGQPKGVFAGFNVVPNGTGLGVIVQKDATLGFSGANVLETSGGKFSITIVEPENIPVNLTVQAGLTVFLALDVQFAIGTTSAAQLKVVDAAELSANLDLVLIAKVVVPAAGILAVTDINMAYRLSAGDSIGVESKPRINLVPNPGFEQNLDTESTGWLLQGGGVTESATTGNAHSGTMKMELFAAGITTGGVYTMASPAVAGETYQLGGWIRSTGADPIVGGSGVSFGVAFFDKHNAQIGPEHFVETPFTGGGTTYVERKGILVAPVGSDEARVLVRYTGAQGRVYVDDVEFSTRRADSYSQSRLFGGRNADDLHIHTASSGGYTPNSPNWADGTFISSVTIQGAIDSIPTALGGIAGSNKIGFTANSPLDLTTVRVGQALDELDHKKAGIGLVNTFSKHNYFTNTLTANTEAITATGNGTGSGIVASAGTGAGFGILGLGDGAGSPPALTHQGVVGVGGTGGVGVQGLGNGANPGVFGTSGTSYGAGFVGGVNGIGSVTASIGNTGVVGSGGGGTTVAGGIGGFFFGGAGIAANADGGVGARGSGGNPNGSGIGGSGGFFTGGSSGGVGAIGNGTGTGFGFLGKGAGGAASTPAKAAQGVVGVGGAAGIGVEGVGESGAPGGKFTGGSTANGIEAVGNGSGAGGLFTGGASGPGTGIIASGGSGSTGGSGVLGGGFLRGTGVKGVAGSNADAGATFGLGGWFIGAVGAVGGAGLRAEATVGTNPAIYATSVGSSGAAVQGLGGGNGGTFTGGTGAGVVGTGGAGYQGGNFSGTTNVAITLRQTGGTLTSIDCGGFIDLSAGSTTAFTDPFKQTLTQDNLCTAWAVLQLVPSANPNIISSFNIATATQAGNTITVSFPGGGHMSAAEYPISIFQYGIGAGFRKCMVATNQTASGFDFIVLSADGSTLILGNDASRTFRVHILVHGRQ